MAINRKDKRPYMHWTHHENGTSEPRRFHKIITHFDNGPGIELKGNRVPYSVVTHSGDGYRGQHEAHFYYESDEPEFVPNFHPRRQYQASRRSYGFYEHQWLSPQNITNIAVAMVIFGLLRLAFVGSVLGGY